VTVIAVVCYEVSSKAAKMHMRRPNIGLQQNIKRQKCRSNLAKGDISRLKMSYAKEMLSTSSTTFIRWQHASRSWSCGII